MRRRDETVTLTCSVYDIELHEDDRAAYGADPDTLMRQLIAETGAPAPNGILRDFQHETPDGGAGPNPPVTVHVDSPPHYASRYIIFIS